jgi:hypothetical protein
MVQGGEQTSALLLIPNPNIPVVSPAEPDHVVGPAPFKAPGLGRILLGGSRMTGSPPRPPLEETAFQIVERFCNGSAEIAGPEDAETRLDGLIQLIGQMTALAVEAHASGRRQTACILLNIAEVIKKDYEERCKATPGP